MTIHLCPSCHVTASAGTFCGSCGFELANQPGHWRTLMRPGVFAAAPRQPVALPLVSSTLFPRLPKPYRRPFQHGLILTAIGLVVFSMLRWLAPLVVMTTLGVLLLFLLYLWQSNVFRHLPGRALAVTSVVGAVLGAGWWLWASGVVARAYDISIAAGALLQHSLDVGFLINGGGALLMAVPVVAVRLLRVRLGQALDGFVVGALGALCYSSASTITWLAPQYIAGLINNFTPGRLLEEAVLYAVADPLMSAAVGGLIGTALWFTPDRRPGLHPRWPRATLVLLAGVVLLLYFAAYEVEVAQLSRAGEEIVVLSLTALALLVLRAGLQVALLHEAPDPVGSTPVRCGFCDHTVPATAFCTHCGGAARACGRADRVQPVRSGTQA